MKDHLLLQKNGKLYLFLRQGEHFYRVSIDRHYTDEAERLLLQGNCSGEIMKEIGLKYEAVPVENIASVQCRGYEGGDTLGFIMRAGKNGTYILSDDTTQEVIDRLFSDVPIEEPASSVTNISAEVPPSEETPKIRKWGRAVTVAGSLPLILWLFKRELCLPVLCVAYGIHLVALILYFRYPQHFTLVGKKKREKDASIHRKVSLDGALFIGPLFIFLSALEKYNWENVTIFLVGGVIVGLLVSLLLYFKSEEQRKHPFMLLGSFLIIGAMAFGILAHGNHYCGSLSTETGTVTELRRSESGRNNEHHSCIVEDEQGEQRELPISKETAKLLEIGDQIRYYDGVGALGVSYTCYLDKIE